MSLYNDISTETVQFLLIAIGVAFAIVVYVVWRDRIILRKSHDEIDKRVQRLRLNDMISRVGIPFSRYDHKTSDLDKERHIWACEHCPEPEKCERMFDGEDLDPAHFCPNYRELKKLKG